MLLALASLLLLQSPEVPMVVPVAQGTSRGGVPLVAVGAPDSPWCVAQLHLRLPAEDVPPRVRSATQSWLAGLAEVGGRTLGEGGRVQLAWSADDAVVSLGTVAGDFDLLLRAVDAVLRARSQKPATPPREPERLVIADDSFSAEDAAVLALQSPRGLGLAGTVVDAAAARVLGDALRADRAVVVVVGPRSPEDVLARATRVVTTPVPRTSETRASARSTPPVNVVLEHPGSGRGVTSMVTSLSSLELSVAERAAMRVVAALLGGRMIRGIDGVGVVFSFSGPDRAAVVRAEADRVEQLRRIAAAAPPPEVVDQLRAQVFAGWLGRLRDPAAVAFALGQAVLSGDVRQLDEEAAALQATDAPAVQRAAALLAEGSLITRRVVGRDEP